MFVRLLNTTHGVKYVPGGAFKSIAPWSFQLIISGEEYTARVGTVVSLNPVEFPYLLSSKLQTNIMS